MNQTKSKIHSPRRISLLILSIFLVLFHSQVSKHKKASKSQPDSEDLDHLRSQLKQLIKQQKIFNLIKKKGKNVKLAQQEADEGTEETPAESDPVEAQVEESPEVETPEDVETPETPVPEEETETEEQPAEETETPEEAEPAESTEETQTEEAPEEEAPAEEAPANPEEAPSSEDPVDTPEEEAPVEETPKVEEQPEDEAPEPEAPEVPEDAPAPEIVPEASSEPESAEEPPKAVAEDCQEEDTEEECLEKRLKSKLVHLLGVFDSLYSSMEEVCQASESVCKKILDRIKDFENLRPESSEKELEDVLKKSVKETSENVFEIAKQQLELKGEDNISKLKSMIGDESERLIKGFQSQLGKFENEDQLKNQVGSQTTKVLKNLVESFYLNDYLKSSEGELSTEESEESEEEDDASDPEDTLIKEITGNSQTADSDKLTGLASSGKTREAKKKNFVKKKKGKKRNKHKDLDLNLDALSDKTTLELLSSLLK